MGDGVRCYIQNTRNVRCREIKVKNEGIKEKTPQELVDELMFSIPLLNSHHNSLVI